MIEPSVCLLPIVSFVAFVTPSGTVFDYIHHPDPTKFFGFELGAQTTLDDKNDRYIINGSHSADRLRELLDSFIEKFVLCQSCKNPETDLKITKADGMILRDCKACGKRSNVDMRHKLTTFITKNPPPKKSKKGQGVDASEAENNGINGSENNGNGDDAGSDDELTKRIQEEAKEIPTAEQRSNGKEDDEDWSVDTSEAAVAARIQALEGGLKGSLTLNDDENEDGEDEDSPYSLFGKWCKESKVGGESSVNDGQGPTPAEVYKKAQEFGIEKKHKTLLVLVQNLFTENAAKEVEKFAPVLSKVSRLTSQRRKAYHLELYAANQLDCSFRLRFYFPASELVPDEYFREAPEISSRRSRKTLWSRNPILDSEWSPQDPDGIVSNRCPR